MTAIEIGRLLRSGTSGFVVGCRVNQLEAPAFGGLVRVPLGPGYQVYGLIYDIRIEDDGLVRQLVTAEKIDEDVIQDNRVNRNVPVEVSVLSMGNPHAVQVVADVDRAPVTTEGPRIEHHRRFPQRVNAGYLQVIDRANIRLRVWERGVGETLACGTGACAAVVAGIRRGLLDPVVRVVTRGGTLVIEWRGPGHPVLMTGPAVTVFEGAWEVPAEAAGSAS